MKIHILPASIADQIAAGEVVERPASVVKELVENSLDAGAKNIDILIEHGGKKLIEVRDDGQGMDKEDAQNCVLRHATSKIQTVDDLFRIHSFGFRGEALAAISSVSHFELLTRTQEATAGIKVKIDAGKELVIESAASNIGTCIKIQDLFYPTPARLAYLKTEETEYRNILKQIMSFALSHFDIGFRLLKDEKEILNFPPTSSILQRITQVLPRISSSLIPVQCDEKNMKLSGFVVFPGQCSATKAHQYFFVNHRNIEDFKLNYAIREAYVQSAGIEKHLHPLFILFLDMDPILVDINVHPRKLEVKFAEPSEVFLFLKRGVMQALKEHSQKNFSGFSFGQPNRVPLPNTHPAFFPFSKRDDQFHQKSWGPVSNKSLAFAPSENPFGENKEASFDRERDISWNSLLLIGQVDRKYILAQTDIGLVFFDQHALHERQRFEHFWKIFQAKKFHIQKLLIPQKLYFSESEISLFHEHQKEIQSLGFALSFPEDTCLQISEVPSLFESKDLEKIFQELVEYFEQEKIGEHSSDIVIRKLLEYKACRGAVMFGDLLSKEEMQKLLDDFKTTEWRNLCPHGRPNHVFLSSEDLNKRFHR